MSSNPIFFAPLRVPVTNPATGLMAREWYLFFQAMFNRLGGSTGHGNDDLEQLLAENQDVSDVDALGTAKQLSDAQANVLDGDGAAAELSSLQSQVTDLAARIEDGSAADGSTQNALDDAMVLAMSALDDVTPVPAIVSGTFAPTVLGSTTAGVGTYTTQQGNYTRIGDRLFFNLRLKWTATTGTGNLRVGGLPFPSNAGANGQSVPNVYINSGITDIPMLLVISNSSLIEFDKYVVGTGVAVLPLPAAADFWISGSYLL